MFSSVDLLGLIREIDAMKQWTIEALQAAWKRGGKNGGRTRAQRLSKKRLSEIARLGGLATAKKKRKALKDAA